MSNVSTKQLILGTTLGSETPLNPTKQTISCLPISPSPSLPYTVKTSHYPSPRMTTTKKPPIGAEATNLTASNTSPFQSLLISSLSLLLILFLILIPFLVFGKQLAGKFAK